VHSRQRAIRIENSFFIMIISHLFTDVHIRYKQYNTVGDKRKVKLREHFG
jgi:hypothetical protein